MGPTLALLETVLSAGLRTLRLSGMLETLDAPPHPGPSRPTRPPRFPPTALPGRNRSPRGHVHDPTAAPGRFDVQATLEGFDFAASFKLPAPPDPRPRCTPLAP